MTCLDSVTGSVHTEGAELVYDRVGQGPVLLAIPGAGGDGRTLARLAAALADQFTVLSLDRRGNGRSGGERSRPIDMAQQARDVHAVLANVAGGEPAFVFGHSGGGNIGLVVAAAHPQAVRGLVVHEPPALAVVPDGHDMLARNARLVELYRIEGAEAAFRAFVGDWVGVDAERLLEGRQRAKARGVAMDLEFFFAQELVGMSTVRPDFAAIRRHRVPVAVSYGAASGEAYYVRAARAVALQLGCPLVRVPGHHLTFQFEPAAFATELKGMLATLGAAPLA